MIIVEGKKVCTELHELVDPEHSALVLVDMQRDFVEHGGAFDELGIDLRMYPPMRPRLASLLAAARQAGVLVVHVQMTALPGRRSDSPAQIRFNMRMHAAARQSRPPLRYALPGTAGHQFVEELVPRRNEVVVPKWRSSGFWGTNLDLILRSNGIETVIITGCTTEGCVESTARDAMFNDYYVVVVEDCVASDDVEQHRASLTLMRHRFDISTGSEVASAWNGARERAAGASVGARGDRTHDLTTSAPPP